MYHMFIVSLMNYLFQRVVPTFQLSNNCLCIITQGNNQVVSDKGHDRPEPHGSVSDTARSGVCPLVQD